MRETPLAALHAAAGARFVEFGGWRLPVQFSSIAEETRAARRDAALFDISHMGHLRLRGGPSRRAGRWLLTRDVSAIPPGCSAYALLCNDQGGILDDLFVMVEAEQAVRLVVNAANHQKDLAWMRERTSAFALEIEDLAGRTFGLALQGPRAEEILRAAGVAGDVPELFATFTRAAVGGADVLLSRTGYTGEDGFELFGDAPEAARAWQALSEAGRDRGLLPAGLGARDVLRQEMSYPLWGQDIDEKTTPLEARLSWAIEWGDDFIGRDAIASSLPARRRIALVVEGPGVARAGARVLDRGRQVGTVTSGTYSHNLGRAIGQAYITLAGGLGPGDAVDVEVRGRPVPARLMSLRLLPAHTRPSWTADPGESGHDHPG